MLGIKFQIINLIKEKKIEEALEIIEKEIPDLIEDNLILAFMKAHIFLRIVKEGNFIDKIRIQFSSNSLFSKRKINFWLS